MRALAMCSERFLAFPAFVYNDAVRIGKILRESVGQTAVFCAAGRYHCLDRFYSVGIVRDGPRGQCDSAIDLDQA